MEFELKKRYNDKELRKFASIVESISDTIGMKVSSRGWCYILEGRRLINKNQFEKVATLINDCRKKGFLPVDFCAEESARAFEGVVVPHDEDVVTDSAGWLRGFLRSADYYNPDWWEDEEYYIQMVVEKIDLVTMFKPVCATYKIPIANSKGWSSILQRAEYSRRYAEAEQNGKQCVLLYCGDHDPDGLRISEFIRKNLEDVKDVRWNDGMTGFDPENLIIERFGLNYDFIQKHKLTWIDNLITGNTQKVMDLASPTHKNHKMPYVQHYLKKIGARKCEANAVITMPREAQKLCRAAIEKYLGTDAQERFSHKRDDVKKEFNKFLKRTGLDESIAKAIEEIDNN